MLMRGSQIVAEAAVRAGLRFYAGYPITPQNELPEYLSARLPEVGGVFIQGESEIASVNMIMGASVVGARVMTSSSSPGISLKQEGFSYLAGLELPAVIANIMRGGPGLGNIQPAQADYFQATRGGGNGDYRFLVFAPAGAQELCDITTAAFEMADKYRNPVMLMGDGLMGQVMEPVIFPDPVDVDTLPKKDWVLDGCQGRAKHILYSMKLEASELLDHNLHLQSKYDRMTDTERRWEYYQTEGAEVIGVAYGTVARIMKGAVAELRKKGYPVGLFRPISLWPFPKPELRALARGGVKFAVFELSAGQMVEDVALSLGQRAEIIFHGLPSGPMPTPSQMVEFLLSVLKDDGRLGRRYDI
jgi:2-oxoglutarate/2-oxoacid ferredoxin oxidoreductase subunit alpha